MYPSPHLLQESVIDLRAVLYDEFEASLLVKCMSSRFKPCVFLSLLRKLLMALPLSPSLWYICAESKLMSMVSWEVLPTTGGIPSVSSL